MRRTRTESNTVRLIARAEGMETMVGLACCQRSVSVSTLRLRDAQVIRARAFPKLLCAYNVVVPGLRRIGTSRVVVEAGRRVVCPRQRGPVRR